MKKTALVITLAVTAAPAWAMPITPSKPVPASFFSGRWYEIARTPNSQQRDCEAPTYQFAPKTSDTLSFTLTCHKGEPAGKPQSLNVTLHLPEDDARNKFRVTAMGGIASLDYWVLDRADDGDWWILATPKNPRVWLLSRNPNVAPADKIEALARMKAMGFDPAKLEFPKQA
jgi:apolipoprotein D and lipocalin family protein